MSTLRTHHVASYIEFLGRAYSPPSVKQHLAAIRMLFDWFVVRQVVEINPAAAVRGPKHVVKRGKTPVLDADEARHRPLQIRAKQLEIDHRVQPLQAVYITPNEN